MYSVTTSFSIKHFRMMRDAILFAAREAHAHGFDLETKEIKNNLMANKQIFEDGTVCYDFTIIADGNDPKKNFTITIWET